MVRTKTHNTPDGICFLLGDHNNKYFVPLGLGTFYNYSINEHSVRSVMSLTSRKYRIKPHRGGISLFILSVA